MRELRLAAVFKDSPRDGFAGFAVDIGHEHPSAPFGEKLGNRAADAVRSARYNRHLVLESRHDTSVVGSLRELNPRAEREGYTIAAKFAGGWPETPSFARVIVKRPRLAT